MEGKSEYKKVVSFCEDVNKKSKEQLDMLMKKWMQSSGKNEYLATAIAMLHNKLGNSMDAILLLETFINNYDRPAPVAKQLLGELYYKQKMLDAAVELYDNLMSGDYSNGFLVNKYLWCMQIKLQDARQSLEEKEVAIDNLLMFINKVLKNEIYDIHPADLHQNLHIGTKIIRTIDFPVVREYVFISIN